MSASSRSPEREPAVVAPPVQRRRVRPGPDDRGVADLVALQPGPAPERALQPALAADRTVERRRGISRTTSANPRAVAVAGVAQPADLPVVLGQAQLVDDRGQPVARRAAGAARRAAGRCPVSTAHAWSRQAARARRAARRAGGRTSARAVRGLLRGGHVADPDRAELVVGEVALAPGVVVRAHVQGRVVARRRVGAPARAPRPRPSRRSARRTRARPERVLGVVGAGQLLPGRHHDQLPGQAPRRAAPGAARSGPRRRCRAPDAASAAPRPSRCPATRRAGGTWAGACAPAPA